MNEKQTDAPRTQKGIDLSVVCGKTLNVHTHTHMQKHMVKNPAGLLSVPEYFLILFPPSPNFSSRVNLTQETTIVSLRTESRTHSSCCSSSFFFSVTWLSVSV